MSKKTQCRAKTLGVFSLAMINCAAVASLKNLPAMAEYGLAMVFFYAISVLFFLIPTALISAELATGFPEEGGIFNWVNKALGERFGFLAVWLQCISNAVSFPSALAYMAALIAYAINKPELANNSMYVFLVIVVVNWGGTFIGLRGMKLSSIVTNVGSILGTLIPGIIIISLGIGWICSSHPSCTDLSITALVPRLNSPEQFVFLLNVLLGFAGLEMSAAHARDVENPKKDYPKAILISTIIIFCISSLGSLAIAVSVNKDALTLESGVIQAIESLFAKYGLSGFTNFMAVLMVLGTLAWFVAWVEGPARGVLATAKTGNLPPFLQKTNKNDMPSSIMIWQAIIVTLFSMLFLFVPSVTTAFWMFVATTAQVLLIMYILMFISGIILRFKCTHVQRSYKVPFGNFGIIILAVM
jgi:amino acid transporter